MVMGAFSLIVWWESRGANLYLSAITSPLERVRQVGTLPQNPLQSHSAFCIRVAFVTHLLTLSRSRPSPPPHPLY
ncbi:hypothetical protein EXN66_Car003690 [Channa argus]|uniref:Uncharacterized protein n=1 Tax=Channa argus TaxID=215402 RepID=A0A6G1PDC5_CHAAH|nr:hypothetical protein EXN66_Car003690 [Channa argus]